jgi:hypothetical protein
MQLLTSLEYWGNFKEGKPITMLNMLFGKYELTPSLECTSSFCGDY